MSHPLDLRFADLSDPGFRVVVSTAIVQKGHVLLVKEGQGNDVGRWNLPGGKVELREPLVDAAVREAREESGYDVAIRSLCGTYRYTHRSGAPRLRIVFWADVVGGEPACDGREIRDVRWFGLDQALDMPNSKLAKAQLNRAILADLKSGQRYSLRSFRDVEPRVVTA